MIFKNLTTFKAHKAALALLVNEQEKKNWQGNGKPVRHKNRKVHWLLSCLPGKTAVVERPVVDSGWVCGSNAHTYTTQQLTERCTLKTRSSEGFDNCSAN